MGPLLTRLWHLSDLHINEGRSQAPDRAFWSVHEQGDSDCLLPSEQAGRNHDLTPVFSTDAYARRHTAGRMRRNLKYSHHVGAKVVHDGLARMELGSRDVATAGVLQLQLDHARPFHSPAVMRDPQCSGLTV